MSEVTQILAAIEDGDSQATAQLLPLVYEELRKLAAAKLANEKPGQTLQATALVHEAYLRLVDREADPHWDSRGHFFAAAAESMRRILVERARHQNFRERQGLGYRTELGGAEAIALSSSEDFLVLNEALSALEAANVQAAELVKLRFFAGLTQQEAAEAIGLSRRVADRLWKIARAWLSREMGRD